MTKSYIEQLHYVRIPVRDLTGSTGWYTHILGLQLLDQSTGRAILKLNEGPLLLVLIQTENDSFSHFVSDGQSQFSLGFSSPELTIFRQHLINHQVEVDELQEDNGHLFFHFYDPSGNKFQVHW